MIKKLISAVALVWGCMASASAVTLSMGTCFGTANFDGITEWEQKSIVLGTPAGESTGGKNREAEPSDGIVLDMGEQFGSINIDQLEEWQQEGFSFRVSVGENAKGKVPCYKSKNKEVRLYALNTLRIEAPEGCIITSVSFVLSPQGIEEQAEIRASTGEIQGQSVGGTAIGWTGNTSSVTFTVGETNTYHPDGIVDGSGQLDFTKLIIKTDSGTETGLSSTFDSDASDAPIAYYTLNGMRVAKPSNGIYICKRGWRSYKVSFR